MAGYAQPILLPDDANLEAANSLLEVAIAEIPIPGDDVPLEEIVDFARDSSFRERRERFTRLVARASIDATKPESFQLDLADAIADYSAAMRIADLRSHNAAMTLLLSVAGAAEELFHGRPRKAIESLVQFRSIRADRLEAELLAPGREVAFIYEAEKRFGGH